MSFDREDILATKSNERGVGNKIEGFRGRYYIFDENQLERALREKFQ